MVSCKHAGKLTVLCLALLAIAGCDTKEPISFLQDVQPILEQNRIACHTAGEQG